MYQGKNPKAINSQKLLLDSLNELMKEKDFKDISISELCSHSGVSRQTFYSLFETKENILLYQLELLNNTKPDPNDHSVLQLHEVCERYAQYVSSNYHQLSILVENNLTEVLYDMIYRSIATCTQSFVDLKENEREYAILYMSSGLCLMTKKYVSENQKPNRKELTRLSYKIMSGKIFRI